MKPQVQARDAERLVVDLLTDLLENEDCTVGVGVPEGWTPSSPKHLQVASDGEPTSLWPVATQTTIRLVAHAGSTTEAKALCALASGLFCAHNGEDDIVSVRSLTGVLPARDPDTDAELAAATVRVTVRTEPIETGS
jgi:hypothetical protein